MSTHSQTSATDPAEIVGVWRGTATAGDQTVDLAFDIRQNAKGVGLLMTLPRLHAWQMPVAYLEPTPAGSWSIPDWHIVIRRAGMKLVGELGDPRVVFDLSKAEAAPRETSLPSYPQGPSPSWTYEAGAPLWGSPVPFDGVVFIGDTGGTVHAVTAAKGTRVWTAEVGAAIYGAPLAVKSGIFVFDDAGVLHKLDRKSGKEIWRATLGADSSERVLPAATVFAFDFHAPAPVLRDGTIYIASPAGKVHAIDAASGRVEWRADLRARVRASAAVSSTRVFLGTLANDVVALDRRTGHERWRFAATGPVASAPSVVGDLVVIANRGSWITALNAASGSQVWARYDWFSWIESTGVVEDSVYYVGSSDLRTVRALDARTGQRVWETDVLGWAWGTPALTRDTVYIGVAAPQKYVTKHEAGLFALDRKTGAVRWRRPVASSSTAFVSGYPGSVILVRGTLIAPNVNGTLEGYVSSPASAASTAIPSSAPVACAPERTGGR